MSLLSPLKLNVKRSSLKKAHLRSYTQSTDFGTDRTLKTQRTFKKQTSFHEQQLKLQYTVKKQLFVKGQVNKLDLTNVQQSRSQPRQKSRIYHSVEAKLTGLNYESQSKRPKTLQKQYQKTQRYKSQFKDPYFSQNSKMNFPIEFRGSSIKNKFSSSSICAYGLSTCKGDKNVVNSNLIIINLGFIKQFYIVECIDGPQCGNLFKKNMSFLLLRQYLNELQENKNKNKPECLESALIKSFKLIKKLVQEMQKQSRDNSGCFVTGALMIQDFILTINCGVGTNIIYTKSGNFFKSAEPHSTTTQSQYKRIINGGNQMYRTQFSIKYRQNLSIKGPIRLYPSGHTFTRVLGKTLDKVQQSKMLNTKCLIQKKDLKNPQQNQRQLGLLSEPQIRYVSASEIQFIIVTSSYLQGFMQTSLICSIILNQLNKYGKTLTIHELAAECARQILNQAYLRGFKETSTIEARIKRQKHAQITPSKRQSPQQKFSLRYLGHKKSFCKYKLN